MKGKYQRLYEELMSEAKPKASTDVEKDKKALTKIYDDLTQQGRMSRGGNMDARMKVMKRGKMLAQKILLWYANVKTDDADKKKVQTLLDKVNKAGINAGLVQVLGDVKNYYKY